MRTEFHCFWRVCDAHGRWFVTAQAQTEDAVRERYRDARQLVRQAYGMTIVRRAGAASQGGDGRRAVAAAEAPSLPALQTPVTA